MDAPESPVLLETPNSPAGPLGPSLKRKGKSRILNGFQRISSSPSLARMGITTHSAYRNKRASASCISLASATPPYGFPFTPTLSAERDLLSPSSTVSTPGVLIPVFDERARLRYLDKIDRAATTTIPRTVSALVCTPITAAPTTSADYDYFSIPLAAAPPRRDFNFWRDLPSELRTQILAHLHPKDIVRSSAVSKQWHRNCFDGQLWAALDTAEFYQHIPASALIGIITSAGPFLRDLNLRGCVQLRDKWHTRGFADACRNLEFFSLEGCKIDRTTVHCFLLQNPRLTHVNLTGLTNVTNAAMKVIAQSCPNLEHLNVSWCHNVDTRGLLKVVQACPNLSDLRAGEVRGWDSLQFAQLLFEKNNLETLQLTNCDSLTDDALRVLMQGDEFEIDWSTGKAIVPDRKLKHLDLLHCRGITDEGLRHCAGRLPNLEGLQLGKCTNLTDSAVKPLLASMSALSHLDLEELDLLSNASLQALASSPCAPRLRHLSISYCESLGDAGMLPILKNCPCLQSLDLDNTRISDLVLVEAAAMVRARSTRHYTPRTAPKPTLRLMAYDCQNVTWTGVREIISRNAEVVTQRRMVPGPRRPFSSSSNPPDAFAPSAPRRLSGGVASRSSSELCSSNAAGGAGNKSPPAPATVSTETVQLVRTYPSEVIELKCFYNYQPTVREHTKRVLRGDYASANRLERKWAEFMVASEEAGADGAGLRRRRRRARLAEMMHADEADSAQDLSAAFASAAAANGGASGAAVVGQGGEVVVVSTGPGVGGGRRRRARSGGCAVM